MGAGAANPCSAYSYSQATLPFAVTKVKRPDMDVGASAASQKPAQPARTLTPASAASSSRVRVTCEEEAAADAALEQLVADEAGSVTVVFWLFTLELRLESGVSSHDALLSGSCQEARPRPQPVCCISADHDQFML